MPAKTKKKTARKTAAKKSAGRPSPPVRWTVGKAAAEFGVDRRALDRKLANAGVVPGADGKYSTRDICAAVFTSAERARARKAEADAAAREAETQRLLGRLVEIEAVKMVWAHITTKARARLKSISGNVRSRFVPGMERDAVASMVENEINNALHELARPVELSDGQPGGDS